MPVEELLALAHRLALPEREMCILAEGNVSTLADNGKFWVKGSGQMLASMAANGFSLVDQAMVVAALDQSFQSDAEIRAVLNDARTEGPNPSTETFMHADLLSRDGVRFVAHTHPIPLLSLISLQGARDWVSKRLFPDEIVLCGPASCFVPYVAPGLELARAIVRERTEFRKRYGIDPKTYWLENHGLIVVGRTASEVESGCLMAVKAAKVLLGALQTGREIKWLTDAEVDHIYNWPDEHDRQRAIWK